MPYINPLLLTFGLWANYSAHLVQVLKGEETVTLWKLCLPAQVVVLAMKWGWWGVFLIYAVNAVLGCYYFTMALMNHNVSTHHIPWYNRLYERDIRK